MRDSNHLKPVTDLLVDDKEGKPAHDVASRAVEVSPPPVWTFGNADDRPIQLGQERMAGSLATG